MREVLSERLRPPPQHAAKLTHMKACFDLRQMASSHAYVSPALQPIASIGNVSPLEMLGSWMGQRDVLAGLAAPADDIPSYATLNAEFTLLCERLRGASSESPFRESWSGASGTVIMRSVFTMPRFYSGCHGYLHLFAHCALKTMNEAVVEGMGGVWDRAAEAGRHLSFEASVEEAVLAWSAPQPYHVEAVSFINDSLVKLFGDDWPQRFHHVNERVEQLNPWTQAGGMVVSRLKRDKRRLPAAVFG